MQHANVPNDDDGLREKDFQFVYHNSETKSKWTNTNASKSYTIRIQVMTVSWLRKNECMISEIWIVYLN